LSIPLGAQSNDNPDIIIRGIDTNIDPCSSISLMLTAGTNITSGFNFNISTLDLHHDLNTTFDWNNNIENTRFRYIGSDTIQFGDNLCIVILCQENGGGIMISHDGNDVSSDFETTNTHGILLENNITEGRGIYLTQGEFIEIGGRTRFLGDVFDGLYLSSMEEDLNQPYPLGSEESKVVPLGDGIFAYIQCIELDDCDPIIDITNKGNWTSSIGTIHDDIDLEALCLEYCDFECNDTLVLLQDTTLGYVYHGFVGNTIDFPFVTNIYVNGESLAENPLFTFPYCIYGNCTPANCAPGQCANPNMGNSLEEFLISIGIEVFGVSFPGIQTDNKFSINVASEAVNIELEVYDVVNDVKQTIPLTPWSGTYYHIKLVPDISCDIDSILWSSQYGGESTMPYYDVNNNCDTIKVNIICADGCEYNASYATDCQPKPTTTEDDYLNLESIEIRPNPASHNLMVQYNGQNKVLRVEIFNLEGQLVTSKLWDTYANEGFMNVSHLPPGMYIIQLVTNTSRLAKRVAISQ
ncbi:MAG: T9SS type A sorting domain-containing protein, partial [Bacteroidota bacterium]